MNAPVRAWRGLASIALAASAGCTAVPERAREGADRDAGGSHVVAAERARNAVSVGRSTRSEVMAALGQALILRFDSGYEVWVYRLEHEVVASARARRADPETSTREQRGEFVILFAPSGVATKVRLRPGVSPR